VAAGFVDLVLVVFVMVVVGLAFGQGHSNSHGASVNLHGASIVVFLILVFAYYAALELLWGQTLGKRLFRIRVISRRGDKPSAIAIAARTLFRAIDFLPLLYVLGLIAIVASRRGDNELVISSRAPLL
jgi:uncharacterized RDD family membrane protein YckC